LFDPSLLAPDFAAPDRPLTRVGVDDAGAVRDFLTFLEPRSVAKFRKIRVGADHDGGYVMLDDFTGIATALSLGAEVSWDIAIAGRGIRVLRCNRGVDEPPTQNAGRNLRRAEIAPIVSADL
jgi:hypothetical protein